MKNNFLLIVIALMLTFLSCKKSDDTPDIKSLPKTYTEEVRSPYYNAVQTFNLVYDSKNRLGSMISTPNSAAGSFLYQYPTDKTIIMQLMVNNNVSIYENMWLNASSYLDSTFQYNDTEDTTTEKYVYDANHLLVSVHQYEYHSSGSELYNTTTYTYDSEGNALTQSESNGHLTSFTYYPEANTLDLGNTFFPPPKHLIKTATSVSGGLAVTATHYYSFDGSNRLVKDSAVTTGLDATGIKTYTY